MKPRRGTFPAADLVRVADVPLEDVLVHLLSHVYRSTPDALAEIDAALVHVRKTIAERITGLSGSGAES